MIVTLHEFLHSIINPLTKNNNYFNGETNYFKEYYTNSYNNDYYVVNENVVRAIVIRIISGLNIGTDIQNMIENEVNNGFELVPIIYNKLEDYEHNRNKYICIDLFYNELLNSLIWR